MTCMSARHWAKHFTKYLSTSSSTMALGLTSSQCQYISCGTWKYAVTITNDTITTEYPVHCCDITAYITLGKCVFSEYYTI